MKITAVFGIEPWLQVHKRESKLLGSLFCLIAITLAVCYWGIGAGILVWIILLMTVASLIILLLPLRLINKQSVVLGLLTLLLVELIL